MASPSASKAATGQHGAFQRIQTVETPYGFPVQQWRSSQTGLTVVLAEIEGPLVQGFLALPTEAYDNKGNPHVLGTLGRTSLGITHLPNAEHLIFLGSEDYPYKGLLDTLANVAIARGTNAWTDTDHTAYTLTTGGRDGFLAMLPIFMDHILYPTITDTGFLTEVHHIDGNGRDAGVVYCEMQGRENTEGDLVAHRLATLLFPGRSPFHSETGGKQADLRVLTVQETRQYHRDYYRPDNLCVIVTGAVAPEAVFAALAPTEAKLKKKMAANPYPIMKRYGVSVNDSVHLGRLWRPIVSRHSRRLCGTPSSFRARMKTLAR